MTLDWKIPAMKIRYDERKKEREKEKMIERTKENWNEKIKEVSGTCEWDSI